jgi:chitodextrinase
MTPRRAATLYISSALMALAPHAAAAACAPAWNAGTAYTTGQQASENAIDYQANWWTQGQDPATNSGPAGSGAPWTAVGSCSDCKKAPPAPKGLAASGTTANATQLGWTTVQMPNCTVSGYTVFQDGTAIATAPTPSFQVSGLAPKTAYRFDVEAVDSVGASRPSHSVKVKTGKGGGGGTTTGTISFHLLLGLSAAEDSLTLDGGNYTDLIMSNVIAGVMYAHLVGEGFPGTQFNRDYLVGSLMGQLLQENIATEDYVDTSPLIDPSPDQQAVMGAGQGGPYQINNYAVDMVSGTYAPEGHALINYVAIQDNIGFTMANASTQYTQPTPPSFNNKYYGPLLPAFFHYNDMVALQLIGAGPNGWQTPWQPEYDQALVDFLTLPNSFLDVILNVAYNQGYYGPLVPYYSTLGATATAATIAAVNSYTSVWGSNDTYLQYPYQVHYYLDQLYDNRIPTTSPANTVTPQNHVIFPMAALASVFVSVAQTLDYQGPDNTAPYFTAAQAQTAFTTALTQNHIAPTASLDLSNATDRAAIFAVIDSALANLEATSGQKFNATTMSQL